MNWLYVYRKLVSGIWPLIDGMRKAKETRKKLGSDDSNLNGMVNRVWVHVASAGELEIAWPVIEGFLKKKIGVKLSFFSRSTLFSAGRLKNQYPALSLCLSPSEGAWESALTEFNPALFISVKYEAWPDLWASLSRLKIPLSILGGSKRRSLKIAHLFIKIFGLTPPRVRAFSFSKESLETFADWPWVQGEVIADPRWERVAARQKDIRSTANQRVHELVRMASCRAPRPWVVLGSVWDSDLQVLAESFEAWDEFDGTFWLVPHQVSEKGFWSCKSILRRVFLKKGIELRCTNPSGESAQQTTQGLGRSWFWVNETGILPELYAQADWAFVGGGFHSQGLHSTIEPAAAGLKVGAGPSRFERFDENLKLAADRRLSLIRSPLEFAIWLGERMKEFKMQSNPDTWSPPQGGSERFLDECFKEINIKESRQ